MNEFDRKRILDAGSVGATVGGLILRSGRQYRRVAEEAGVCEQTLALWRRRKRGISVNNLVKVLDALGYDLVIEQREDPGRDD